MIDKRIGILGGGQLGKMLCISGAKMDMNIQVMDKSKEFPAAKVCLSFKEGDITNLDDVIQFGRSVDILTYEFEKVNIDGLKALEKEGVKVFPSSAVLSKIQDKGIQKQFFKDHDFPTSGFSLFENKKEILEAISHKKLSLPFVQKTRRDGYDGQGVKVCIKDSDLEELFDTPSLIEDMVDIGKEIAVIVCRNADGALAIYDPVEMVFDAKANLLDYQLAPARIDNKTKLRASELAYSMATKIDLVGLLAIEIFINTKGQLLINEMAPRPHNSGHHTIEACYTSQYENHLRAITNMPLGKPDTLSYSLLINLLGSPKYTGDVMYSGIKEILNASGAHLHIYGKQTTKPFRKMGHITILHEKERTPLELVNQLKTSFKTAP